MKTERFEITANGFTAELYTYILYSSAYMKIQKRPLILICPGGGYEFVSEKESEMLALKFVGMGYHAAVLKYSVKPAVYPTQIMQTAQAWKLIHDHADEWNVLTDKMVICGCSAGGHLAASYGIFCTNDDIASSVNLPAQELRPAGMILCYPVITAGEYAHKGSFAALLGNDYDNLTAQALDSVSLEKQVSAQTPPAFIWHTFTDNVVPVENSLLFTAALRKNNVNAELHIFPDGGHGLCLSDELTADLDGWGVQDECRIWTELARVWLKNKIGLGC